MSYVHLSIHLKKYTQKNNCLQNELFKFSLIILFLCSLKFKGQDQPPQPLPPLITRRLPGPIARRSLPACQRRRTRAGNRAAAAHGRSHAMQISIA
jgi:hypothetical protein